MQGDSSSIIDQQDAQRTFREKIDVSQLDEEASETFVFQEVTASKRPRNVMRKAVIGTKRGSVYDVVGSLTTNNAEGWVDQIVQQAGDKQYETPMNATRDSSEPCREGIYRRTSMMSKPRASKETEPLLFRQSGRSLGRRDSSDSMRTNASVCLSQRQSDKIRNIFEGAFAHVWIALLALPLTALSCFLFYWMGNPSPDFLPGDLKLSWLANFLSRHLVLVATSQLIQFLLLDTLLLKSRRFIHLCGPFAMLTLSQAKGWPFIVSVWTIFSLFLLHGNNAFQMNWFYWTGWSIFSASNSGGYILNSHQYRSCLMGLLVAGICTTLKRTYLTVAYGHRQFEFFRPKLESLLEEVLVVSEIALLSAKSVDDFGHRRTPSQSAKEFIRSSRRENIGDTLKSLSTGGQETGNLHVSFSETDPVEDNSVRSGSSTESQQDDHINRTKVSPSFKFGGSHRNLMKHLLDRWEEPQRNDSNIDIHGSIADVLRFQRALQYMDDEFPFGEDFGFAPTRAECVSSSQKLFEQLCSLHSRPGENLPFECFDPLMVNPCGNADAEKRALIRRLFRPDSQGQLDMFSFVQSVDSIYRRLRYFGASVENDAVLDKVLERIYNGFYYFVLGLLLLSMFHFNPWSMLVSITSLLVSLSFAFGQTVARYVQGILTVANTRPFDLGDRIYFGSLTESGLLDDISALTWFVEEITLTNTKLRYAMTGEVMFMSNHLISTFRVYNYNRTTNASIAVPLLVSMKILDGNNFSDFKAKLLVHVTDYPRRWDGVQFIRIETIDPLRRCVALLILVRHRNSWQDASRIRKDKGIMLRAFHNEAKASGFSVLPQRSISYDGGVLPKGVDSHWMNGMMPRESAVSDYSDHTLND